MSETRGPPVSVDVEHLQQWIHNEPVVLTETLDLRPALGMAAMLDQSHGPSLGMALPPLWHWVYFTPAPLASELGADGHPVRGGFLPPVPLPRRMWAASSLSFHNPLYLGETVQKHSRVNKVELKQGNAGPLVFLTVEHKYSVNKELRISEEQTIVYVSLNRGKDQTKSKEHPEQSVWSKCIQPDPVLLFRYSALMANTHRIHYDRDYAVGVEHHGGLVVQGPLTATLLAELLRERFPSLRLTEFSFRALRPLLDTMTFTIHGKREEGGLVALWALDADKKLAVQATARVTEI